MRTFSLFLALAALASSVLASNEAPLAGRATPVAAQVAVERSVPTPELDRRQNGAGLGGGAGVTTSSIATLESISGYTPPASSVLAEPDVPAGTIISAAQIPGYNDSASSSGTSGAESLIFEGSQILAAAGGVVAGAAYILF